MSDSRLARMIDTDESCGAGQAWVDGAEAGVDDVDDVDDERCTRERDEARAVERRVGVIVADSAEVSERPGERPCREEE